MNFQFSFQLSALALWFLSMIRSYSIKFILSVRFCSRQNQVVLLDTLEQEISKFKECHSMLDINALVSMILLM
jgi:hypothetical protein